MKVFVDLIQYICISSIRYFTSKLWIIPASNGCKRELIFLGKKQLYLDVLSNKRVWVHSRVIQKQDHFSIFTDHLTVKLSQNILHNSYLHPGFKVRKVNDFGNFLCTTNSVKALGLVEAPDCNWRFHFLSISTNKKSYSYHLIRPLTTLSFSPLFGKTFRWESFNFINIPYIF